MTKFIGTSKVHFELMQKAGVIIPPFFASDSIDHAALHAHGACSNIQANNQVIELQKKIACLQRRALLKLLCRKMTRSVMRLDPIYGTGRLINGDSEDLFIDSINILHRFTPFFINELSSELPYDSPLILEVHHNETFSERSSLNDFFGKFIAEPIYLKDSSYTEDGLLLTDSVKQIYEPSENFTINTDFLRTVKHNHQEGAQRFWDKLIS